jgi:hypothetical protein
MMAYPPTRADDRVGEEAVLKVAIALTTAALLALLRVEPAEYLYYDAWIGGLARVLLVSYIVISGLSGLLGVLAASLLKSPLDASSWKVGITAGVLGFAMVRANLSQIPGTSNESISLLNLATRRSLELLRHRSENAVIRTVRGFEPRPLARHVLFLFEYLVASDGKIPEPARKLLAQQVRDQVRDLGSAVPATSDASRSWLEARGCEWTVQYRFPKPRVVADRSTPT